MHRNSIVSLLAMIFSVSQVIWARCICDPADSLCLENCVSSANDCIDSCTGKGVDACYTNCINSHWPGATFEDPDNENTIVTTKKAIPTTTSKNKVTVPTMTQQVTAKTTITNPVDDIWPYLFSFFGGMMPTQQGPFPQQPSTLPTSVSGLTRLPSQSDGTPLQIASTTTSQTSSLPTQISSILSEMPTLTTSQVASLFSQIETSGSIVPSPIQTSSITLVSSSLPSAANTLVPSLMTTHTTITSLVTITPNATDVSTANKNPSGLKNLAIGCSFLLTATFIMI